MNNNKKINGLKKMNTRKRSASNRQVKVVKKNNNNYIITPLKRSVIPKVYMFKKHVDLGFINSNTTVGEPPVIGTLTFKLNDLPNFAQYQAMFDRYRLLAVKVSFIPRSNITDSINQYNHRIMTAVDLIGNDTPSTLNDIRDYESCKVSPGNVMHVRYFKPRYTGAVFAPWLSTADQTAVVYRGLHYGVEESLSTSTILYSIEAVYYLQFDTPK